MAQKMGTTTRKVTHQVEFTQILNDIDRREKELQVTTEEEAEMDRKLEAANLDNETIDWLNNFERSASSHSAVQQTDRYARRFKTYLREHNLPENIEQMPVGNAANDVCEL